MKEGYKVFSLWGDSSGSVAFSLVEVVVALAVLAFAILIIVGTLPMGLSAARSATNITLQAQIVKQVSNTLQQTPFVNLSGYVSSYFPCTYNREGDVEPTTPYTPTYFTVTGTVVSPASMPCTNSGATAALNSSANLALVQLVISTADHTTNHYTTVIANLGSQ